ncbi:uracil phosphoribosyltransferase homolog isoform X2 [Penaeus monodon]|nr:uracil phosphoribosyltransferase homolog isoform X2 [Penaeus monodon]
MGTMSEVVTSRPPAFEKKSAPSQGEKHKSTCQDQQNSQPTECFGPFFRLIPSSGQVKELQTIIRDKNTSRSDFKFYADRLIRLVVEEGLNQLPYSDCTITTPTGCQYKGLQFVKGNCGVSIVRSGEAMEQGLRSCCRSIRLGKILVESDLDTHEAKVVYAKFPEDISQRKVLLMYPIMSSGNTVIKAVNVLQEHAVEEENIILLNLFSTPAAARTITSAFPKMNILTSEVHPVAPNHFGQKYFGTD